jgi:hypothetical protein
MSASIPLSRGLVAIVDDEDLTDLSRDKWYARPGSGTEYAKRQTYVDGRARTESMHSRIMRPPAGMIVDHINHDGLDNRRSNLRVATYEQNARNKVSLRLKSGDLKGASWDDSARRKYKWAARIYAGPVGGNGKRGRIRLGYFATEEEAALAYDVAAREHFGEFAFCNFPDGTTLEQALALRAEVKRG